MKPRLSLECTIFEKMARKRLQRKGSVAQRFGQWLGRYRVDSATEIDQKTGKPIRERITVTLGPSTGPGRLSKEQARAILHDEYLVKVNASTLRPSSTRTLAEFLDAVFIPDYLPSLKPSGQAFYRSVLATHLVPTMGAISLRDITPQRVQRLMTAKASQKLSTQTVRHIRNCLSAVLREAKRLGWFYGELPTVGVRLPEMVRRETRALTWEQVEALATTLQTPGKHKKYARMKQQRDQQRELCATLVLFLAATGLRIGEATGLRWIHVNLSDQPVHNGLEWIPPRALLVRENWVRGRRTSLKTGKSRRTVPLPEWLIVRVRGFAGKPAREYVFSNAYSQPLDQHNLAARVLKPAAQAIGLPWISWHTFRHTFATMTDQSSLTTSERMKLMGHSSPTVTAGYTHPEVEEMRRKLASLPVM